MILGQRPDQKKRFDVNEANFVCLHRSQDKECGGGMNPIQTLLNSCGAVRKGHFVLSARGGERCPAGEGDHSEIYIAKERGLSDAKRIVTICTALAELADPNITMVTCPAVAGIVIAQPLALAIAKRHQKESMLLGWADKAGAGEFKIGRSFADLIEGQFVAIGEDVITYGRTASAVEEAICKTGGTVAQILAIWNRGAARTTKRGTPILAAVEEYYPTMAAKDCELCKRQVPMNVKLGHGEAWHQKNPHYPVADA
jgi:orotate phosphoribosyltransferase